MAFVLPVEQARLAVPFPFFRARDQLIAGIFTELGYSSDKYSLSNLRSNQNEKIPFIVALYSLYQLFC